MQTETIIARLKRAQLQKKRGDADLNPGMTLPQHTTKAAVLIPLVDYPEGIRVILTQRTAHLAKHAGQVSFPGGKIEPDESPLEAALREAWEEIGLASEYVEIIGQLEHYITGTGFEVTPLVALVQTGFTLKPDPFEVARIFDVPLSFLLNPNNRQKIQKTDPKRGGFFYAFQYNEHLIWGATAGMIVNLCEVLEC